MSRKLFKRLLLSFLIIMVVLVSAFLWLFGTSGGARYLLKLLAHHYSVTLNIEEVKGKLLNNLRLEGLQISRDDISLEAETFVLSWQPIKLLTERNLAIEKLDLKGKDMILSAAGNLHDRIEFAIDIKDLSGIIRDTGGSISSDGWIRKTAGEYEGSVSLESENVMLYGMSFHHGTLEGFLQKENGYPVSFKAEIDDFQYNAFKMHSAVLNVKGTIQNHTIDARFSSAQSFVQCLLSGEYKSKTWDVLISRLDGTDNIGDWGLVTPATIRVSSDIFFIKQLNLQGEEGEHLDLDVTLHRDSGIGSLNAIWKEINLARTNQWLKNVQVSGICSGAIDTEWEREYIRRLSGEMTFAGSFSNSLYNISVERTDLKLEAGTRGLNSLLDIILQDGGILNANLNSPAPTRFSFPEKGEFEVTWKNITLFPVRPAFPEAINIQGTLDGHLAGKILPRKHLDLSGETILSDGALTYTRKGIIAVEFKTAEVSWIWRDKTLSLESSLVLAGQGKIRGNATLPLPASLPVSLNKKDNFKGATQGDVSENGLLSAIFPGLVQESSGELSWDINVGGTLSKPNFEGSVHLSKAGAYLPSAGIRIDEVSAHARLNRDRILLESLEARSGEGSLKSEGEFQILGWEISNYQLHVSGDRFQTIYLPELKVVSSPELSFEGTPKRVSISGEVEIPELIVSRQEKTEYIEPSKDVVMIDTQETQEKDQLPVVEMNVRVIFGERVFVRASGVDVQLGGDVQIISKNLSEIKGEGLITVLKGHYKRYGVNLEITRGRIIFTGGAIDNPSLDILALREIGDIRAGVVISGTPRSPKITLYSEPPMPDADILAYIVLGHPLGEDKKEANLVLKAANILASSSESTALQEQLKQRTGLDVLDIESGNGEISRSMLTIGKYLSPKLYISFGQALFGEGSLFRMRYTISRHWEFETQSGTDSGVDFYYKLDFK